SRPQGALHRGPRALAGGQPDDVRRAQLLREIARAAGTPGVADRAFDHIARGVARAGGAATRARTCGGDRNVSAPSTEHKGWTVRLSQAVALAVVFSILLLVNYVTPSFQLAAGTIACVGFLLLAAILTSELLEVVGLPHLT